MVPLFKPYMPENLDDLDDIMHSGALSYGKFAKDFEYQLSNYLDVNEVLVTNSHNSAMLVLLTTLGLVTGDEVLVSPMSCLASVQPLLSKGLILHWVDIDPYSGTLDPECVQKSITKVTRAIFHNHHCGIPGYIDEINKIAKDNGLLIIDDCIEAFGSEYKGRIIGDTGSDASIYSFQTVRLPNTIDGGAMTFRDPSRLQKAKLIRDYGVDRSKFRDGYNEISEDCDVSIEGYGALMSEVNGYIGYKQMKEIDVNLQKQRDNAKVWKNYFREHYPDAYLLGNREGIDPNYWVFNILTSSKMTMLKEFRNRGYYASGVHINNNIYSAFGSRINLNGADDFYKRHLALPCGWWFKNDII